MQKINVVTADPTDANESKEARRERELEVFRRRVNVYNLGLMAANRGLSNKFTLADAKQPS